MDEQKVRAKFTLQEVRKHHWGNGTTLVFRPEYDLSIPEDQRFATATPSGEFTMYVDNPSAVEFFELGKPYYVDFTRVPAK